MAWAAGPRASRKRVLSGAKDTQNFRMTIAGFSQPPDSRRTRPRKCPRGTNGTFKSMTGLLFGYARVSTNDQDLTAQKNALAALGVTSEKSSHIGSLKGPTC